MDKINKGAAAGVIFFSIVLAGFVGIKVDQTTIALLGGAFIGLVVAIPTTALIMMVGLRKREDTPAGTQGRYHAPQAPLPASPPQYWVMPQGSYSVREPQQAYPAQPQALQRPLAAPEYLLPASRRRFYMIGEGGEVKEIEAPQEPRDTGFDEPNEY
jgi:hypothetical protein